MWQVIRDKYPSSFAATKETINEVPHEFLAILAYIGGYPRGFEMCLESAGSVVLSRPSSSEWSDAPERELSLSLISFNAATPCLFNPNCFYFNCLCTATEHSSYQSLFLVVDFQENLFYPLLACLRCSLNKTNDHHSNSAIESVV